MTFGTCRRTRRSLKYRYDLGARGLIRSAGLLTWFLAGLPLFSRLVQDPDLLRQPRYGLWLACFSIFGATFGLTRWNTDSPRLHYRQLASLVIQSITALIMISLVCTGHEGTLLVLVAAQLGWFIPLRPVMFCVQPHVVLIAALR